MSSTIKLGIVGVGKIVRDQHLPSIYQNTDFELVAAASRNAKVDDIANFTSIEDMLSTKPDLDAVALCMPPRYRYQAAHYALDNGYHVLLEKPPGASVVEVETLITLAEKNNVSLFATWHSRFAAAVETAKNMLADTKIESASIVWKEDVRKWHVGQQWIWQAGGFGVFDPGINALSILTHVLSKPNFVKQSELYFPVNKDAPIAATMMLNNADDLPISVEFDWRQTEGEVWQIEFVTDKGLIKLYDGGACLSVDENDVDIGHSSEYGNIYSHFSHLLKSKASDVDLAPLKLVADAFMLGARKPVDAFLD